MFTAALRRSWQPGRVVLVALGVWLGIIPPTWADEPAVRVPGGPWPSAILLEPPADRATLLDRLRRPDLILWDGPGLEGWLAGRGGQGGAILTARGVVGSVAVSAHPAGPRASLTLRFGITVEGEGRCVVPIALDGLILGRVSESGTDLAVSTRGDRRGWALELVGQGEHLVEVETGLAVRSVGAGQSLELAIPAAASTTVELVTTRTLLMARAGPDEPLAIVADPDRNRASGHLGPRGRLELNWQEREPPGLVLPTMLAARGEVAITVGLDALETRETWSVAALRGQAHEIVLQLKTDEEVVALELDRRPVPSSRRHLDQSSSDELVIPLAEPVGVANTAMLVLATRQPRATDRSGGTSRFSFAGHPIRGARSQSGVIGVVRSPSVEITPVVGPTVQRIDPRTDLPDAFRGRPDGWLGFEFAEQPFDLKLAVAAVTPQFEVNARSTLTLAADRVAVATTLSGRVWKGRLFEVQVEVPGGLTFQPTEPRADGPTIRPRPPLGPGENSLSPAPGTLNDTLIVSLPRPVGPGETFTVTLRGQARVPVEGSASIPLFQPLGATVTGSEVALVSGPDRQFHLPESGTPRFVRLDPGVATPADWSWPPGYDPSLGATVAWLHADRATAMVRVEIISCPRSIRHRSSVNVAVDRQGASVVDEIIVDVAHGVATTLEVALPPLIPDGWLAEAGETLDTEPLDPDPVSGWRRYRINLGEPVDSFQVRIRYRLDFHNAPVSVRPAHGNSVLQVQPVQVRGGTSTGQTVRLLSESDVDLAAQAPGWIERSLDPPGLGDSVQQIRHSFEHPGDSPPEPITATVALGLLADLPALVASRLWLRSIELPGGALASTFQFRLEAHGRSVVVRLPHGSRWVRGMAGPTEVGPSDVELVAADTYRVTLPAATGTGPVPLRIDTIHDQPPADGSWPAPELVDGVIQQSVWELKLLGTRAGVGVPSGWTDENQWFLQGFLWVRGPRRSEVDLTRWLTDGLSRPAGSGTDRPRFEPNPGAIAGPGPGWSGDFASGSHSYLFSRPGPPTTLRFRNLARATLVLLCSGPVLLVGLLILGRRPPPRWVIGSLLVLALGLAATVEINTALLVIESSAVGFALAASAALIHHLLDRRGRAVDTLPGETMVIASSPSELSVKPLHPDEVNGPTIIRSQSPSPLDSTSEFPAPPRGTLTIRQPREDEA